MKTKTFKAVVAASVVALSGLCSTQAVSMMVSLDGSNWTSLTPGLDFAGGSWMIQANASSDLGVGGTPGVSVESLDILSLNGGTIWIRTFDTGMAGPANGFFKSAVNITGLPVGSAFVQASGYVDSLNNGFSTVPASAVKIFEGFYFGATSEFLDLAGAVPAAPFSLMIETSITLLNGGVATLSQSLVDPDPVVASLPDGGSALALLGFALAGLGWGARLRKN